MEVVARLLASDVAWGGVARVSMPEVLEAPGITYLGYLSTGMLVQGPAAAAAAAAAACLGSCRELSNQWGRERKGRKVREMGREAGQLCDPEEAASSATLLLYKEVNWSTALR